MIEVVGFIIQFFMAIMSLVQNDLSGRIIWNEPSLLSAFS